MENALRAMPQDVREQCERQLKDLQEAYGGVARRTMYYKPTRSPAKVKTELAEPIKELIEAEPSFGYCTVAALLGMHKNTVQRIFQLKGWQVRKRALGQRPRRGEGVSRRTS